MPRISKQLQKIISLSLFVVIVIIKSVCFIMVMGLMDSFCIAGWHVNTELANNLILLAIGFIPDIFYVIVIAAGLMFKDSNIGADPRTIVYNFLLGLLCIGGFFPFFGLMDCGNPSLSTIRLLGVLALVAGIFHIANAVACLLYLAREEKCSPAEEQRRIMAAMQPSTSRGAKCPPGKAKKKVVKTTKKKECKKPTPKPSPKPKPKPKKPCPKKK